jgi:hypothetical protein
MDPKEPTMNLLRATLAVLFALAFAVPSQASPEIASSLRSRSQPQALFATGMHANQVEPLVRGIAIETASVAVYTTCYLALASDSTCVDVASKARTSLTR